MVSLLILKNSPCSLHFLVLKDINKSILCIESLKTEFFINHLFIGYFYFNDLVCEILLIILLDNNIVCRLDPFMFYFVFIHTYAYFVFIIIINGNFIYKRYVCHVKSSNDEDLQ